MNLAKAQKKFIKKNLNKLSLAEIANKLAISQEDLEEYLKAKRAISPNKTGSTENSPTLTISWFPLLFLAVLVFAVYSNSLGNEFLSDDIAAIKENKGLGDLFYLIKDKPLNSLRYFVYFIIFEIGGRNPALFRLFGILCHLGSAFVIYGLISLLYDSTLALMVASIFAVHPAIGEAVVWISGAVHSQYVFFALLSLLLYMLARAKNWQPKYYFSSLASFTFALLTTEKAAPLSVMILAYEFMVGKISQTWKRILPYIFLSFIWTMQIVLGGFLGARASTLQSSYYQEKGFYNPLTQIPTALASYLYLIFWPKGLTLYHSEMVFTNWQYLLMFMVTLGYFGAIIYTFLNKKYRHYSFWLSFFIIALIPMLTPFKVAWIVAERYMYFGALGIFVLVGWGIKKIGEKFRNSKISWVILGLILAILSARGILRNLDWKNQDTLWLAAKKTSPSSPQNHNNLGDLYSRRGDFEKAVEEFKQAIALLPNYGDAYHNLANTYLQMGKLDLAIESYNNALKFNPMLWQSHQNLAAIYARLNRPDLMEEHLKKGIEISPQNPVFYYNLGLIYLNAGKKEEAKAEFQKVLLLDPNNQEAQKALSLIQ